MSKTKVNILCHLYYREIAEILNLTESKSQLVDYKLFFNLSSDNTSNSSITEYIHKNYSEFIIISTPNIGKDIGAKLALMDLCLQTNLKSDYLLFLHDKQSPQVLYSEKWKNKLMKIAEKDNIKKILEIFERNPDIGIVCSAECISNEYDEDKDEFKTTNNLILKKYIKRFNFKLKDYSFVAGNMFWARSCIYEEFFKKYNPLELRGELEKANVLDNETGTKTHSLERVFSWIATNQGYKIYGI